MPPKRTAVKVSEKTTATNSGTDLPAVPEELSEIAQALRSAELLPEACRLMLVAGLEGCLDNKSPRDHSKSVVAGYIGEVLAQRKAALATVRECLEADVSCAKSAADENAETVRKAEEVVAHELSFVSAKKAIFDEDDKQLKEASDLAAAAESARSACEANLLAMSLERDDCEAGRKLVNEGASSDDIKTEKLVKSISMIQHLAAKLGLEQSLVLTLQFMAKKPMGEWSNFEQAAARMIDTALAKHITELASKLEEGAAEMIKHGETVEAAQKKRDAAKERCQVTETSFREAESKHNDVAVVLEDAKKVALYSAAELERAQGELSRAEKELNAFVEGPMETFLKLHGSPAVERSRGQRDEPAAKKLKLTGSFSASEEQATAVAAAA